MQGLRPSVAPTLPAGPKWIHLVHPDTQVAVGA